MSNRTEPRSPRAVAALTLGALGVVYGDIGTSPLYALKEIFRSGHVAATEDNILGVLSLVFWTITVIVSIKYVLLVLRADNNGEGGLIAMLALATHAVRDRPPLYRVLSVIGPNSRPMPPVPKRWAANRPVSTTSVTGITQ